MESEQSNDISPGKARGVFPPETQWSTILCAGRDNSPEAREAFGRFYETYRPALLVFLRNQGMKHDKAEEILQGFFTALLSREALSKVDQRGKFRSWLLACLKNYTRDCWDHENAAIRRPPQTALPIGESHESGLVQPPGNLPSADKAYDKRYAIAFLECVLSRLEHEFESRGKGELFKAIAPLMQDRKDGENRENIGSRFGMTANAVNQEVFRMRERYRTLFRQELTKLCGPDQFEEESRHLLGALTQ